jgi:thymidylate synthase
LWYLTRDNRLDFIRYYIPAYDDESEDNETVYGGYGPRIFDQRGQDQLENVLALLGKNPESRRAVIQIFEAEDVADPHKEVPCTCTMQFLIRRNRLHMLTNLRSNDAYKGLPHDVFCFTMIQELVARVLGVQLGTYSQFIGSLHVYDDDVPAARQYLDEGFQSTIPMPPMPKGDPRSALRRVLDAEHRIRAGADVNAQMLGLDGYWADLVRLLQIYASTGDIPRIETLKSMMIFDRYGTYIDGRKNLRARTNAPLPQLQFPF